MQTRAGREPLDEIQAQYLVCTHLTRACRRALIQIALDDADNPEVRRRAVALLKGILADWTDTERRLRVEISRRQKRSSLTHR